jgi:hypothetical protein
MSPVFPELAVHNRRRYVNVARPCRQFGRCAIRPSGWTAADRLHAKAASREISAAVLAVASKEVVFDSSLVRGVVN